MYLLSLSKDVYNLCKILWLESIIWKKIILYSYIIEYYNFLCKSNLRTDSKSIDNTTMIDTY